MAERGCITELESDRISEISDCKSLPMVTVLFPHRWFSRSDYRCTRPEAREGQQSVHDYHTHFKDGEAEAQMAREEQEAFLACTKELSGPAVAAAPAIPGWPASLSQSTRSSSFGLIY